MHNLLNIKSGRRDDAASVPHLHHGVGGHVHGTELPVGQGRGKAQIRKKGGQSGLTKSNPTIETADMRNNKHGYCVVEAVVQISHTVFVWLSGTYEWVDRSGEVVAFVRVSAAATLGPGALSTCPLAYPPDRKVQSFSKNIKGPCNPLAGAAVFFRADLPVLTLNPKP